MLGSVLSWPSEVFAGQVSFFCFESSPGSHPMLFTAATVATSTVVLGSDLLPALGLEAFSGRRPIRSFLTYGNHSL